MFHWLRQLVGRTPRNEAREATLRAELAETRVRLIKARYDLAQTTDDNRRHWANADCLSAAAANSLDVRKKMRERSRYEISNNSWAKGIGLTLANNLVGPGPRLQITTPDPDVNRRVEAAIAPWFAAIRLADQLRTMKLTKYTDGEPFAIFATNPRLATSVKLDLRLVECDQFTSPTYSSYCDASVCDGIRFDASGEPVTYDVLRYHPGDSIGSSEYDTLPASRVIHWYRCDRPGQVRGVPELTPALPLFAQLRRFTLATLTAAETAAMFAAVLKTQGAGNTDEDRAEGEPFEGLEIDKGLMTTLPGGYEMQQFKAEHPNSTMGDFVRLLLCEIARCLNMPLHLAMGDYSNSNYSSARLGSQDFRLSIKVERQDCEREVLDRILQAWLEEALLIPNLLPESARVYAAAIPHVWHWPAWDYIDPMTEASADTERLNNGTTTLAAVCAERGADWQEVRRQQATEAAFTVDGQAAAQAAGDVQQTALNGLQIASLLQVVDKLALGQYPPDTVEAILRSSFPAMDVAIIRQIIQSLKGFTPPTVPGAQAPAPAAAANETPLAIAAAGMPRELHIASGQPVELQAAAADPAALRTFRMTAYTGVPLKLNGWTYPVVVDLAGLDVPRQNRPILRGHREWKILGHSTVIAVTPPATLVVEGVISGTGPDAKEVLATATNGFPWQASIGANPDLEAIQFVDRGQSVEVNGSTWPGPLYVSRKTTLREISFVPLGADDNTTASVAANGANLMTFEQWLLGFLTIEEFQALSDEAKGVLQKVYDAQAAPTEGDETPPPDMPATGAPPTPAAAAAGAAPLAIAAAGTTAQAVTPPVSIAARRAEEAAEVARVNTIRRICASNPDREIEVGTGRDRRRVNLHEHAITAGWTAQEVELHVLRDDRSQGAPFGFARGSAPPVTDLVIEAAMCRTLGLRTVEKDFTPQTLEAADRHYRRGIGLHQLLLLAAAQAGYNCRPGERITTANLKTILRAAFHGGEIRAGWTPLSVPGILSNVANKEILAGYMEEDQTWREIASIKSVGDFKAQTSYRLLDSMEYEKLGAGGEIKHGSLDEESYFRQADTYAKMLALTRKDLVNDDLGAFDDLKARLGRGAAQKFNNVFWTEFLSDASTFWTAARTNYIEGSTTNLGTDGVGLGLGVKAFRQMRSPSTDGSKRVAGRPEILLVPPELETIAEQYYQSRNLDSVAVSAANIFGGRYRPVIAPQLSDSAFTGYSTTAWYLLRNPGIAAAVVASFLNGQQTPTVEDAEADFNVLGIQFRGYHDYGVDQAEYLCGVKSKGAA